MVAAQDAASREECLPRPSLDQQPSLEDQNLVGSTQRGEAVGNDDGRASSGESEDPLYDKRFGVGVQCRGRLVEDEDRGIL
jgi:hypothetical protein